MSDNFSVPKYGVIEYPRSYPQKRKKATKTGFREWLSVDVPCFYIKDRAYKFTDILLMKDNANRYALVMKYDKVTFTITQSVSAVQVNTYKNCEPYNDNEIGILKGYLRILTRGLSSDVVFSVASELFPVKKLTPLYSYIHFAPEKKTQKKNPRSPKAKPLRPVVLIKKNS